MARFELHIAGDPTAALRLARENWNEQREPADLRILAEAAAATGDAAARDTVNRWLADSGLEYPAVAAITGVGTGGPTVKMSRGLCAMVALAAALLVAPASAHKPSDSYLTLRVEGEKIEGQWDIALRDLDFTLGLDANQDGAITWGEVKAKHTDIAAYALSRLTLGPTKAPCPLTVTEHLVTQHSDGAYAVLRFSATCSAVPKFLDVAYRLFFDIDPQHRGLLNLQAQGSTRAGILTADAPVQQFKLAELSNWEQFVDYVKEGVLHIWAGIDHILFLLSLLLPAVLVRAPTGGSERWQPAPSLRAAVWDTFKIVTAFTIAHSITLSMAALGVISLPSRLVESAIAASVALAALNNIWPVVYGGRWAIAFLFGLIHGFGFASVLADLGLPRDALLLSLVAFNVGVELGQLAIVAVFLLFAYPLRATGFYRRMILRYGSVLVVLIAGIWLLERAFNLKIVDSIGRGS